MIKKLRKEAMLSTYFNEVVKINKNNNFINDNNIENNSVNSKKTNIKSSINSIKTFDSPNKNNFRSKN